jgi:ADP-heptose:LPS heptosyltransferase
MVKFLVVRFSSIGDIILTTPVIRHLKREVEDAEIHFLTKSAYASLLKDNPYIDRIHSFDGDIKSCLDSLKNEGIDYIIDLHHNTRSARIKFGLKRVDFSVDKLNWKKWLYVNFKKDRMPDIHMVDRNLDTINSFIEKRDDLGLDYHIPVKDRVDPDSFPIAFRNGYLGLSIGAQHETKKLPVESLIALCKKLRYPVLVLGGPGDRERGETLVSSMPEKEILNCCGRYNIHQSASLVKQSKVLITHDTGLMHMGAAFQKKIISVWGNTVPRFGMYPYRPDPASVQFEVPGLSCRPCSKIGYQKCPKKHFKCMVDQDLEGIAEMAHRLWDSP